MQDPLADILDCKKLTGGNMRIRFVIVSCLFLLVVLSVRAQETSPIKCKYPGSSFLALRDAQYEYWVTNVHVVRDEKTCKLLGRKDPGQVVKLLNGPHPYDPPRANAFLGGIGFKWDYSFDLAVVRFPNSGKRLYQVVPEVPSVNQPCWIVDYEVRKGKGDGYVQEFYTQPDITKISLLAADGNSGSGVYIGGEVVNGKTTDIRLIGVLNRSVASVTWLIPAQTLAAFAAEVIPGFKNPLPVSPWYTNNRTLVEPGEIKDTGEARKKR